MNDRERMSLAMRRQTPDRVPVMCQLALGHFFLNAGLAPHEIWFTSEGFAKALVKLQRRYRFDGILINLPGRPERMLEDVVSVETLREGERLKWQNGDVTVFPWDDNPYHIPGDRSKPTRAEFETVDPDDLDFVDDLVDYTWFTYWVPRLAGKTRRGPLTEVPRYFHRTIDLVRRVTGGEVSVHGEVFSPFTHYMELFGYEQALVGLLQDGAKARAVLDRLTVAPITKGLAQVEAGVDAVLIASPFAGGPFISRKMYQEFVLPFEKRVTQAIREAGSIVYTHTCGSIGDRLDLMVETGTMGIDTLDPPPLGNTELADAKAKIGDKVFIKGNMNSVELLAFQTREEVVAHATDRIRTGMPGGGYILSTACSVAPQTEPWKLELLVPLAEEIGRYE
jgi:uroporphyrinogen-III decarboxylase